MKSNDKNSQINSDNTSNTALENYKQQYKETLQLRHDFSKKEGYVRSKEPDELAYHQAKKEFGEFTPSDKKLMEKNDNNGKGVIVDLPDGTQKKLNNQKELFDKIVSLNKERGQFYDEKLIKKESPTDYDRLVNNNKSLSNARSLITKELGNTPEVNKKISELEKATKIEFDINKANNREGNTSTKTDNAGVKQKDQSSNETTSQNLSIKQKDQSNNSTAPTPKNISIKQMSDTEKKQGSESSENQEKPSDDKPAPQKNERSLSGGYLEMLREKGKELNFKIPKSVNDTFKIVGPIEKATYFYKDKPDIEAFKDSGKKISTKSDAKMISDSMIALAKSKNWDSIKVNGSDKFKQSVWMNASLNGIEVKGYKPTQQDLDQLNKELDKKPNNTIESTESSKKATTASTPTTAPNIKPQTDSSASTTSSKKPVEGFSQDFTSERQRMDKIVQPNVKETKTAQQKLYEERSRVDAKINLDTKKASLKEIYLTANTEQNDADGKKRAEVIKKHPELAPVYDLEDAAKSFVNHKNNAGKFTEQGKERFISNIREQGINLAATGQKVPEVKSTGKSLVSKEDTNQEATQ